MSEENIEEKKEEKKEEPKKKKGGAVKAIIILLLMFILIPSSALVGFYFLNDTFMYRMNTALSEGPAPVSNYFSNLPTLIEKKEQISSIAEYFLEISGDRTVDKLILINNDEPSMYNDVVQSMLRKDPNKTKIILESIRDKERKGDSISITLEEIVVERNSELGEIATNLQNVPFSSLKSEMDKIINDGLNGASELGKILEQMDSVKAYELLSLLDESDRDEVMNSMDSIVKQAIRDEINGDLRNNEKLINISEIYSSKDSDELIDILGNTSLYTIEELAVIFNELGVNKTGAILAKVEDANLVNSIISEIKNNEVLENGEDLVTKDILKTLKIYKDFDDNILQLTNIYSTMKTEDVSVIIKRLLTNGALPQVYVLDNGDVITITDEELALRILKNFDDKTIAEIISYFESSLASEISKKLTVPEY